MCKSKKMAIAYLLFHDMMMNISLIITMSYKLLIKYDIENYVYCTDYLVY